MSKKIENLKDLFIVKGREIYDASKQEINELPNIKKHTKNQGLKQVLDNQLNMAKNQKTRIQQALNKMNVSPEGEKNESCQAAIKHTKKMISRSKDPEVRDAAIINSIQRLNHDKIASLGALTSYARQLGHEDVANSLHETLNEEKTIDRKLTDIAENDVNKKALTAIAS